MNVIQKRNKLHVLSAIILLGLIVSSFTIKEKKIIQVLPAGTFTATLNDSVPKNWNAFYYSKIEEANQIIITALSGANVSLKISINTSAAGTFEVNGRTCSATYYVSENDVRNGISGVVTITSIDNNKISGTFSFTDGIKESGTNFTNGAFTDVPLLQ